MSRLRGLFWRGSRLGELLGWRGGNHPWTREHIQAVLATAKGAPSFSTVRFFQVWPAAARS